ncbi:MAG: type II secretion system protein [Tenericutes bacterium]|nr:type II secretion system protein [Mycoplasmatota bacterium]
MRNNKAVTIIELIAVLVILGIIAGISVFLIGRTINSARLLADQQLVNNLNSAISFYDVEHSTNTIAESGLTDAEVFSLLVDNGYLSSTPTLSSNDSVLTWDSVNEVYKLSVGGEVLPLSPYGDTFEEIAPEIISDMQEKLADTGTYGRTWGDYRYTDLGLDPEDWDHFILHILYKPSGSSLRLDVEDGYQFVFETISGTVIVVKSTMNWSLIYSDLDGLWYYHSIDPANEIDINTLIVELT